MKFQKCHAQKNLVILVGKCVTSQSSVSWSKGRSGIGNKKKRASFFPCPMQNFLSKRVPFLHSHSTLPRCLRGEEKEH